MNTTNIGPINIIGIAIRTTNENGQAAIDIPALWNRFLSEQIASKIPNKLSDDVYSVYTDYELDHTKPYTTIIGCRVSGLDEVPEGLTGKAIAEARYTTFVAKGKLSDQIVYNEWLKIWNAGLPRTFTADFEVYGAAAQHPENAEVEIFIAVED